MNDFDHFSFQKMDSEILCEDLYFGFSMERFVNKKLNNLNDITLMEVVNSVIYRKTFVKYIQKIHPFEPETESMTLLKRYILCQKILLNHEDFDNKETFEKLIESCPSYEWELKLKSLENVGEKDLHFVYAMEKLKWETIIDLICHNDYKLFLTAVKKRSNLVKTILKEVYKFYYF